MPVTLINGYVLFPDPADWSGAVEWERVWQTGITAGLTGAERRQSLRALAREQLSFFISPLSTLEARAELDERLDWATKLGLACAPYWGRGSTLASAANAGAGQASLTDASWIWQAGDYVFFLDASNNFELVQVSNILFPITADSTQITADSTALTADNDEGGGASVFQFAPNLARSYPAGSLIWPMLFGKFKPDKESAITSWASSIKMTLAELNPRHQPTIGEAPVAGSGIGSMEVGSTFIVG